MPSVFYISALLTLWLCHRANERKQPTYFFFYKLLFLLLYNFANKPTKNHTTNPNNATEPLHSTNSISLTCPTLCARRRRLLLLLAAGYLAGWPPCVPCFAFRCCAFVCCTMARCFYFFSAFAPARPSLRFRRQPMHRASQK